MGKSPAAVSQHLAKLRLVTDAAHQAEPALGGIPAQHLVAQGGRG